jgi:hypothetical protein
VLSTNQTWPVMVSLSLKACRIMSHGPNTGTAIDTRPLANLFGEFSPGESVLTIQNTASSMRRSSEASRPLHPRMAIKNGSTNAHSVFSINKRTITASVKTNLNQVLVGQVIQRTPKFQRRHSTLFSECTCEMRGRRISKNF